MRKYHCPELPYNAQVWKWRFALRCAGVGGDGRWVRRGVCCGIKKRRPLSRLLSVMSVGYAYLVSVTSPLYTGLINTASP